MLYIIILIVGFALGSCAFKWAIYNDDMDYTNGIVENLTKENSCLKEALNRKVIQLENQNVTIKSFQSVAKKHFPESLPFSEDLDESISKLKNKK